MSDMMIADREVDNPYLTDALLYGEPTVPRRIVVRERIIGRIGALCYVRRRGKHHEKAAELFKTRYEAIYGAGVPAFDNARPAVDTSHRATDGGMAMRIDTAGMIRAALAFMGPEATARLVSCIVLEIPCGQGEHWRVRQQRIEALLADLDRLSEHWHLS